MATAPLLTVDCWLIDVRGVSAALTARWDAAEASTRERAAVLATAALRVLTAQVIEPCAYVVRPCAVPCTPLTWATYPVAGRRWMNVWCGGCGSDCCGHSLASIRLDASRVDSVWLDGVELDETVYELRGGRLYRLIGGVWPRCQDLDLPRTAVGTFEVTYRGRVPGRAGELAAGRLAVEYLDLISGGKCALPSTATRVDRQGVSITLAPTAFPDGVTGVRDVDAWVWSINPHRLIDSSEVINPDALHAANRK